MVTDRKESGSYWNDEGAEFLSLVIAATVLYDDDDLHDLTFIYRRVRDHPEALEWWFGDIIEHDHPALKAEIAGYVGDALKARK